MLGYVLSRRNVSVKKGVAIKTATAVLLAALAVALPQLVHLIGGAAGGVEWLPMYLPALIGGCLLGPIWGLGVAVASPTLSFLITLAFGNPMPALARLPFMIVELSVFALVSGAFGKKIGENAVYAFPAVLFAQVCGRLSFVVMAAAFGSLISLPLASAWAQIQTGFIGLIVQAVVAPLIVIALSKLLQKGQK